MNDNFLLDSEELAWVQNKRTDKNRLIAAIMLKFFQIEGHHPEDGDLISFNLISSLAKQLDTESSVLENLEFD